MKYCPKCNKHKLRTQFHKNKAKKDGYQGFCKECCVSKARFYYNKNKDKCKRASTKRRKRWQRDMTHILHTYKRRYGCYLCTENEPICIDFHHIKPKYKDIARLVAEQSGGKRIIKEAAKCVLLCSNCHRKIHYKVIDPPLRTCDTKYLKDLVDERRTKLSYV